MLLVMPISFVTLSIRSEVTGNKYHQLPEVPVIFLLQIQSYFYGANEPVRVIPLFVDFKPTNYWCNQFYNNINVLLTAIDT